MNFTIFIERLKKVLRSGYCIRIKKIKKKKDLRSNESRDQYHEDGYLVPSPRYGFRFEAVFRLFRAKFNTFRIPRKC